MSTITLLLSETNASYTASVQIGELTAEKMSALMHGKVMTKFEVRVDWHQNTTAIVSLSGGDKLHIVPRGGDRCLLHYHQLEKRRN